MNPYLVLGVTRETDDAGIRRAYLEAVKVATPDAAPDRFKALTAAYQQVKDEPSRHRRELFFFEPTPQSPAEVFVEHARLVLRAGPPDFATLKSFLQHCARD